ncbi:kinetochore protein CHL4 like-domain-containing protein [Mucor lusitanicus]|nr:kinetochore protein CHL4 like-domain-containing protein [Mucor lusitanicus]
MAQMELKVMAVDENPRRQWKVFRVMKESRGKLNLGMDAAAVRDSIEKFLAQSFDCYFYSMHDVKSDLHWLRIHVLSELNGVNQLSTRKVVYLVYCPHTEFVMSFGAGTNSNLESYIKEAILHTFNGDNLLVQTVRGQAARHLAHVVKTRKSQGVFAELRTNISYSNPLNIRQKATLPDDADSGEPSRRIKAVNEEEINARAQAIRRNFGQGDQFGRTSLTLDVKLPLKKDDTEDDDDEDQEPIAFELTLDGVNVSNGLRSMISRGQIRAPVPLWLEKIGSTDITKVYITENGASEFPEDDEYENEEDTDNDQDEDQSMFGSVVVTRAKPRSTSSSSDRHASDQEPDEEGDKSILDSATASQMDFD